MDSPKRADVFLNCDCEHHFPIPFAAIREVVTCPGCGNAWRLPARKIERIEQAFGEALVQAHLRQQAGDLRPIGEVDLWTGGCSIRHSS